MSRINRKIDPRKPEEVVPFKLPPLKESEVEGDTLATMALFCSMAGLVANQPYLSWVGLFCSISTFLNTRKTEVDLRQTGGSFTFSAIGLIMLYTRFFTLPIPDETKA